MPQITRNQILFRQKILGKIMIKAIGIMVLFNIPFLLGGAGLIYWGYLTEAKSLTDSESPKLIFYIVGVLMIAVPFLISIGSLRRAVKNNKRVEEIVTHGKPGTAKILKLEDTNYSWKFPSRVIQLIRCKNIGDSAHQSSASSAGFNLS